MMRGAHFCPQGTDFLVAGGACGSGDHGVAAGEVQCWQPSQGLGLGARPVGAGWDLGRGFCSASGRGGACPVVATPGVTSHLSPPGLLGPGCVHPI